MDTNLFFPPRGAWQPIREMQEFCLGCPVKEECLLDAMAWDRKGAQTPDALPGRHGRPFGIRAAMAGEDRYKLYKNHRTKERRLEAARRFWANLSSSDPNAPITEVELHTQKEGS